MAYQDNSNIIVKGSMSIPKKTAHIVKATKQKGKLIKIS